MTAPFLWIAMPLGLAVVLFFLRAWPRAIAFVGAGLSLVLAFAAWQLPLDAPVALGVTTLRVSSTLEVLGRSFTISDVDRPLLVVLFLLSAAWSLGAVLARPVNLFVPVSLAITSLLIAALSVEPFLYAALLIEIAVLLSVPLLVPPGQRPGRGVFRFLAFQTIGMPFILFVGWLLVGVEASPSDLDLVVRAAVLIGLGFAFLLAVFPFHSWLPMLGEEADPFVVAFLALMLPGVVSLFAMGFLNRYAWLRDSADVYSLLAIQGAVMVLLGGLGAALQKNLGKVLGYTALFEIGLSLLSISLVDQHGTGFFFALLLPRSLALIVLGIGVSRLKHLTGGGLTRADLRSLGWQHPAVSISVLVALFTLAGVPLLAAFPVRLGLWMALAGQSLWLAGAALLGGGGLLLSGLRFLLTLISQPDPEEEKVEVFTPDQEDAYTQTPVFLRWFLFGIGSFALLLIGIFPQWVYPLLADLQAIFPQLVP
ncbi:MAG: hypothetical protein DWQ07_22375 [Chloroflexi bacterium]|nr:MAG: hypothetical protein DWQ07_22375 [Chloroflexota bacterium]MBL1193895.1 hypothetical protein [Chloroflexota bacterium]NOH11189.1 hypothetical protein [Chloroflexota bacterium]